MKKIFALTLVLGLGLGAGVLVLAKPAFAEAEASVVDAGNAVCPVSGDKVSGKHFAAYKGKRYGFCCPDCEKEFVKDPEKYIALLEAGREPEGHSH